jgi:hypothetical protein
MTMGYRLITLKYVHLECDMNFTEGVIFRNRRGSAMACTGSGSISNETAVVPISNSMLKKVNMVAALKECLKL